MRAGAFDIIAAAFGMAEAVGGFFDRAREYYYGVMLSGYRCPKCEGNLVMIAEGRCRCTHCRHEFDPTVAFQQCAVCGGTLTVQIRRYRCGQCGQDAASQFLFEGLVFDTQYFREKMAESRKRRQDLREQVRKMLAQSRSMPLSPEAGDLNDIPGLIEALNGLTAGIDLPIYYQLKGDFDLNRYQSHIQAHLKPYWIAFDQIPPLSENARLDRIWRFIAVIFLAQARVLEIRQAHETIQVMKHETDREGQGVFGETEEADGLHGTAG